MKICFIIDQLTGIGGLQRVVINVLNNLAENPNIEIFLICNDRDNEIKNIKYPISDRVQYVQSNKFQYKKTSFLKEKIFRKIHRKILIGNNTNMVKEMYFPQKELNLYNQFISDNAIDIVVGITPRMAGLVSLLNIESKKIGWLHNTFERYFNIKFEYEYGLYDLYKNIFCKLDKLVVLTDHDEQIYKNRFNVSTKHIYNPLSFKIYNKSKLDNNNILFIGRLQYSTKGLDLLGEIIKRVTELNSEVVFEIVGQDVENGKAILEGFLEDNNLIQFVHFNEPTENVIPYYQSATLTVLPSRIEGFGLVVTESMEAGVPVISFKTEGPSEIIENDKSGYLIDKFDTDEFAKKIIFLLNNRNKLVEMGKEAQFRASEFSMDMIIRNWINLFEELTNT